MPYRRVRKIGEHFSGSRRVTINLTPDERRYFRDQLRNARYSALADAEGFHSICFGIEELGLRLTGRPGTLNKFRNSIAEALSIDLTAPHLPHLSSFGALFDIVREARNDAMHTGSYARRATAKALELCLILEDALMPGDRVRTVRDYMVRDPVALEDWMPVAKARQLMLLHSFSNLPVLVKGQWYLVNEIAIASYLRVPSQERAERLGRSIREAADSDLQLLEATSLGPEDDADSVLAGAAPSRSTTLWLVLEGQSLVGVLSPFELM